MVGQVSIGLRAMCVSICKAVPYINRFLLGPTYIISPKSYTFGHLTSRKHEKDLSYPNEPLSWQTLEKESHVGDEKFIKLISDVLPLLMCLVENTAEALYMGLNAEIGITPKEFGDYRLISWSI